MCDCKKEGGELMAAYLEARAALGDAHRALKNLGYLGRTPSVERALARKLDGSIERQRDADVIALCAAKLKVAKFTKAANWLLSVAQEVLK